MQDQQSPNAVSIPQPQQRVHVIKKNIYLMAASIPSNDNGINAVGISDLSVIYNSSIPHQIYRR